MFTICYKGVDAHVASGQADIHVVEWWLLSFL